MLKIDAVSIRIRRVSSRVGPRLGPGMGPGLGPGTGGTSMRYPFPKQTRHTLMNSRILA